MQQALTKLVELRLTDNLSKKIQKNDLASLSTAIKLDNSKDMIINRAVKMSFIENAVKDGAIPYSQQEFERFYKQGLDVFEVIAKP